MNAIEMLLQDHERVRSLAREWGATGDRETEKRDVAAQLLMELEIHSKLEEEIFYPAVKAKGGKVVEDVDEGYQEHAQIDQMVAELKKMDSTTELFSERLQALMGAVEYHVAEEEGEMLPEAQKVLGGENDTLAHQMTQRKQEMLKELAPGLDSKSSM